MSSSIVVKQEYRGYEMQWLELNGLMQNVFGVVVFKLGGNISISTLGQLSSIGQAKTFINNITVRCNFNKWEKSPTCTGCEVCKPFEDDDVPY